MLLRILVVVDAHEEDVTHSLRLLQERSACTGATKL